VLTFAPILATVTLEANASRAAVWQALEAAPRWPEVLTDLAQASITPSGRLEPGALIVTRARPGRDVIDMHYRVLEAEPARRLVLASSANGFLARTEYVLDDDATGALVTFTAQVTPERVLGRLSTALWRDQHARHIGTALRRRGEAMLRLAEMLQDRRSPPPEN
jgi:hypothetical protein